jgi:hypothetical protein
MGDGSGALAALAGAMRPAEAIDWSDARGARRAAGALFDRVLGGARPGGTLPSAVRELAADAAGRAACESYPRMDKVVLWRSADGALRLRLHVFHPGYRDRPHNHRWSFACRVLAGAYEHAIYGSEAEVLAAAERGAAPARIAFAQAQGAGDEYLLDHALVHSLRTDRPTVSLVLRGPAAKDDYFTLEDGGTRVVWSSGAARESAEELSRKAMSEDGFARVAAALEGLLVR